MDSSTEEYARSPGAIIRGTFDGRPVEAKWVGRYNSCGHASMKLNVHSVLWGTSTVSYKVILLGGIIRTTSGTLKYKCTNVPPVVHVFPAYLDYAGILA